MSEREPSGWVHVSEVYLDRVNYEAMWRDGTDEQSRSVPSAGSACRSATASS
jgi:hypothetical protein